MNWMAPVPPIHTVRDSLWPGGSGDFPGRKDPASKIHKLDHWVLEYRLEGDVTTMESAVRCGRWRREWPFL